MFNFESLRKARQAYLADLEDWTSQRLDRPVEDDDAGPGPADESERRALCED